uniref:NADH-ubiquinone oxidoreductase chain 2 n=1 Tax=Ephemera orientalis TaxID=515277 RepID=C3RUM7_9INSE|nr:NADH dehydrogenase subunit 2 [Ephemera orientalis]ACB48053.1 NADH dehydrogenase subunit 2 [Ephemera orientalis]
MLLNPSRLLFLITLILGTLFSISASSWFGAWAGLEINLLSFIPLMSQNNKFSAEAALKYFLVQALASSILLFAVLMLYSLHSMLISLDSIIDPSLILNTALLIKLGGAPFHFWFPGVMEGLNWSCNIILMTWQKMAPMMLLSYTIYLNTFYTFVIISSVMAGSLGGFNQTSLRKIMAYSSINHLGWMVASIILGDLFWFMYFLFYSFLSITTIILFSQFNLTHLYQIYSSSFHSPAIKLMMFLNMLSLGGLPPFLGFLPKWIIINGLVMSNNYFTITVMVIMTLVTLFFYLRLTFSALLLTHSEPKWLNPSTTLSPLLLILVTLSILGLLLSPLLFVIL